MNDTPETELQPLNEVAETHLCRIVDFGWFGCSHLATVRTTPNEMSNDHFKPSFRSSCSNADCILPISAGEIPIDSASLRQLVTAFPTSAAIARACTGFSPKCSATPKAISREALLSSSSIAKHR